MDNGHSSRRDFLKGMGLSAAGLVTPRCLEACSFPAEKKPNFIIIFADDLGYNDLVCYNAKHRDIKTPNLDKMAQEGVRFTNWFSACSVCSPSRAALLTGRYPNRCGVPVPPTPTWPSHMENMGLQQEEVTIAELLKEQGYATAVYGKWHLGAAKKFFPLRHGFDEYYGSLENFPVFHDHGGRDILEGDEVVEKNVRFTDIHERLTHRTIDFMKKSKEANKRFFVYLAHYLVHGPWEINRRFATDAEWAEFQKTKGRMNAKVYPAMVRELDWHCGEIFGAIKVMGLDDNTLVLFTADNGQWHPAGSAWPLRGSKFNTWEGGHRVPSLACWPGKIPPGQVCDQLATTMDYLPTITYLAGAKLPEDRVIDGQNIWPVMAGQRGAKTPHEVLFYYNGTNLQAVRSGKWKLHLPRDLRMLPWWGKAGKDTLVELDKPLLFNLEADIGEEHDVADQYPEVVQDLEGLAEKARQELGDWNRNGYDQRQLLDFHGDPNKRQDDK
ncbi:sulfatase-like hydrolase/transferase [Acidobacteria bacterium AH-259-O06]|nr:sulfatase-like hydrolase/transferase [Acidobacteria bacterium AH-259-O06]